MLPTSLFTFLVALTSSYCCPDGKFIEMRLYVSILKHPRKSTEQPWKVTREELYDGPGLGRNWTEDDIMDKREGLYDGPELGKIQVNGDVAILSERAPERHHWGQCIRVRMIMYIRSSHLLGADALTILGAWT